jgi:class 3 adenylate cyclase
MSLSHAGSDSSVLLTQRSEALKRGASVALVTGLVLVLAALHVAAAGSAGPPRLVGDRTVALLDLWSIQHFCAGVLVGALLCRGAPQCNDMRFVLAILALALAWEAMELAMEAGWLGPAVSAWKDGFEHWGNRFIGDPLMVLGGALVARRFRRSWKVALAPASIWLVANVAAPSSMSIQRLFF